VWWPAVGRMMDASGRERFVADLEEGKDLSWVDSEFALEVEYCTVRLRHDRETAEMQDLRQVQLPRLRAMLEQVLDSFRKAPPQGDDGRIDTVLALFSRTEQAYEHMSTLNEQAARSKARADVIYAKFIRRRRRSRSGVASLSAAGHEPCVARS
jgi:hypothetical protein